MTPFVREDFAGPGGWDVGAGLLGVAIDVGIDYAGDRDPGAAARVAQAAGFTRWVQDVTNLAVRDYRWPTIWLYIASPPCQTFSMAGKGSGREHMEHLIHAMKLVADGWTPEDALALVDDVKLDVRSLLVLEPLLVIREQMPRNVAFEQVKEVQPIWDAYAEILRGWGYSVWTGKLTAEKYGVPQTRCRAILMASLDRQVTAPPATHSRYYSRTPDRLDDGVFKWVSMYEAISMGMATWPSPTVTGGGSETGGAEPIAHLARWADRPDYVQRSNYSGSGPAGATAEERGRTMRSLDQPSVTITPKVPQWKFAGAGRTAVDTPGQVRRELTQPAHTITGKGTAAWVPEFNDQSGTPYDPEWPEKRPPTTVAGREIIQNPGATTNRFNGSTKSRNDGVRVTVQEAGILQSFPADYPWEAAGTKGSQYQRVGDAIPPLLARAILGALLGIPLTT